MDYASTISLNSVVINSATPTNLYTATSHCRLYVTVNGGNQEAVAGRALVMYVNSTKIIDKVGINAGYCGNWAMQIVDLEKDDVFSMGLLSSAEIGSTVSIYVVPFKA